MTVPTDPLGRLELDVLQYIADHFPITVGQVARRFADTTGQARTTVLTVMERLRAKGYVKRRKVGGVQRYSPTITKAELLSRLVGDFVQDVLGGSVSPFVAYLTESRLLKPEESRRLEKLVEKLADREQENPT